MWAAVGGVSDGDGLGPVSSGSSARHARRAVHEVLIGLGSNLGDRAGHIEAGLAGIAEFADVVAVAPVLETAPVGYLDQGPFLNTVACVRTELAALAVLARLRAIEQARGRVRRVKNGPRTLDLDVLAYGDEVIDTQELVVPHPRMQDRGFVLEPLTAILPAWRHPVLGQTAAELLAAWQDSEQNGEMADYTDEHAQAGIDAQLPALETWPNQYSGYVITIEIPEFTSVCPKTELPDFGKLTIEYAPKELCVELKSLKMYTLAYRNLGIFYENVVNRVRDDLVAAMRPEWLRVTGEFTPRGGIQSKVVSEFGT